MSIYQSRLTISLPWAILLFSIMLLIALIYISLGMTDKSFFEKEGPFWLFAVGLVPGLGVALAQFLLSWLEFSKISKFSAMKIKGILASRDSENYYSDILAVAEVQIDVQGVTASRFVAHFADETSNREERRLLISALRKGVKVRFLLPEEHHLSADDRAHKFPVTYTTLKNLVQNYPGGIEVKYFDHEPIVSTVRIDDEVLVGPVFKNVLSRNTPTIHTTAGGILAQSYLKYFEDEWSSARGI